AGTAPSLDEKTDTRTAASFDSLQPVERASVKIFLAAVAGVFAALAILGVILGVLALQARHAAAGIVESGEGPNELAPSPRRELVIVLPGDKDRVVQSGASMPAVPPTVVVIPTSPPKPTTTASAKSPKPMPTVDPANHM